MPLKISPLVEMTEKKLDHRVIWKSPDHLAGIRPFQIPKSWQILLWHPVDYFSPKFMVIAIGIVIT
jgi:hypothetical protein